MAAPSVLKICSAFRTIGKDLFGLLFPLLCVSCNALLLRQESFVCTSCLYGMPRTNFHLDDSNPVAQVFWGRVKIEDAAAMYHFEKGSKCRKLMHHIKYRGNRQLARYLGEIYGSELSRAGRFRGIDMIVPVPLHSSREKERGFNQSEWFAMGVARIMGIPVEPDLLVRFAGTGTQTSKSRIERWDNVKNSFSVRSAHELEYRHVLLVDDVITTGSTLESCARELLKHPGVRISILALAYA